VARRAGLLHGRDHHIPELNGIVGDPDQSMRPRNGSD
jgi:hypothetical protein